MHPKSSLLLLLLAACHPQGAGRGDAADAPTDAPPSDDDDTTLLPGERCADPGPDAPVVWRAPPTEGEFEGFNLLTYIPEDPRGVVFFFYGGDSVSEWVGYEQGAFANLMADAGVGYVVTDRSEPGGGAQWDDSTLPLAENADLARLARLRDSLIETTPLTESTPVISSGFSDGGAFSIFFARVMTDEGWPIAALLPHSAGGATLPLPDVPVWATANEHDDPNVQANGPALVEDMAAAGNPAVYVFTEERPLTPEVFLRNPEWDPKKADEVFADLVAFELIDTDGNRAIEDSEIESKLERYGKKSEMRGASIAENRVRVVWATHRFSAVNVVSECDFVLDALGL